VLIGSHVRSDNPLAGALEDEADAVQFFLGDPQGWKKPPPREDADLLRRSPIPIYVHAPYLINVASANNRIRIPSRKILQDTCDAAADVNATAVIVHGGHADDKDLEAGFERWVKALQALNTDVPVYLENTAGGNHAMARHFDTIARLPRLGGGGGTDRRGRAHPCDHRAHRPRALQRFAGCRRLRRRPARQLRHRADRPAAAVGGGQRR
jgi:deoxyribonuclease-4